MYYVSHRNCLNWEDCKPEAIPHFWKELGVTINHLQDAGQVISHHILMQPTHLARAENDSGLSIRWQRQLQLQF